MAEAEKPIAAVAEDAAVGPEVEGKSSDAATTEEKPKHSVLNSKYPVLLPFNANIFASDKDFATYIDKLPFFSNPASNKDEFPSVEKAKRKVPQEFTSSATKVLKPTLAESENEVESKDEVDALMQNLALNQDADDLKSANKTLTENADVAFISTQSALVDLFYELTETLEGKRMEKVLKDAWEEDSLSTLKIVFNARSIHLGKASKPAAYHAMGWIYQNHPQTFLANLPWLVRPVIEKKAPKEEKKDEGQDSTTTKLVEAEDDDDFDMVSDFGDVKEPVKEVPIIQLPSADAPLCSNTSQFDVKNGVAHGYWKDLLNMLVLAANDEFHAKGDIRKIFNVQPEPKKRLRNWDAKEAKQRRTQTDKERHSRVIQKLKTDSVYEAFHLTVARLFASQLRVDSAALKTKKGRRNISLAAKWAPSHGEFHDKHTFIASSIAEILHSRESICPQVNESDRELYLKHARLAYRTVTVSPIRKFLAVVERDITANTFDKIKYERVPSLAMDRYQGLFIEKDEAHFSDFLSKVAGGTAKVSGAVLLPSTLVSKAMGHAGHGMYLGSRPAKAKSNPKARAIKAMAEGQLLDGQWKNLVQRIRDNGKLESSIAVCDVSGSMGSPRYPDGTTPMHSAIGLSLLLAEVVEQPFGGCFITFSSYPAIQKVGGPTDKRSFTDKVKYIMSSDWGMNTDFTAVFERLILPLAIKHNLKQEDMVKQVFVFSDMQFDSACDRNERWTTSFERIEKKYKEAGYEMPTLVFWNLAGSRSYDYEDRGVDGVTKPVEADQPGVALVSGYSQGQMKMFLDGGKFEDLGVEEEVQDEVLTDDEEDAVEGGSGVVGVKVVKKQKVDPISIIKKAISHPAYQMLKVVD
ncbi:hypothetical protein EJ08DRAFT_585813 [Tothia fuscella]|uniref:Uncharacterized protein n=1 Tax=Tothia fuscella TaxID=1048955 RepID=A0A9P4NVW9_9PEZI|nr:hypothetical protein EJ08DRAFT_585813 [Tothia fuscella]